MFTGIIESLGEIALVTKNEENIDLIISSELTEELKIDQSIAHNGVCLTVVEIYQDKKQYVVTAIKETIDRTNIAKLKKGDLINLERCTKIGNRLDGHIVQGHVDTTAICTMIEDFNGSKKFHFVYSSDDITVEKGSVTVNGTSLTVIDSKRGEFSVAIIPYTLENTVFRDMSVGDEVNIEFDIIGKYVSKLLSLKS